MGEVCAEKIQNTFSANSEPIQSQLAEIKFSSQKLKCFTEDPSALHLVLGQSEILKRSSA